MARRRLTHEEIGRFRARATRAATRLFARRGFEAVTMRAVAQALGCSPMTPYRYFANKAELFVAVRTEAFRKFGDAQAQAAGAPAAPRERLVRLGKAYLAFALAHPDAYRVMFELRQDPAGAHPDLDAQVARSFSFLLEGTQALLDARDRGGDARTIAHLLWAQVHGLASLHLAGKLTIGRTLDDLAAFAFALPEDRRKR